MLTASMNKNNQKAYWVIGVFSVIVFIIILILGSVKLELDLGFNVHIFATLNAYINTIIALLLVAALVAVKQKKYLLHKKIMMGALLLSILFLVSYIAHHLLAGEARFGDADHDGVLTEAEKLAVGGIRNLYIVLLITHIFLAAIILPIILLTAYWGLTAEYPKHKKLARITWPIWFYVAVTGPMIYWMISPYYQ